MPQITTVRVVRSRKVQPEQFGSTGAEVELFGTVLDGEDHMVVAEGMLRDSRKLVYNSIGMKLPADVVAAAEANDTTTVEVTDETGATETVEVPAEEVPAAAPKARGRPPGSKNKPKPIETTASVKDEPVPGEEVPEEVKAGVPDADKGNISEAPEDRVNPEDAVPGDAEDAAEALAEDGNIAEAEQALAEAEEEELTPESLHQFTIEAINAKTLQPQQALLMQKAMEVARTSELDTPEKLKQAKDMLDDFILANAAKKK